MIIELFGPPGAGKTTLAHRLAAELRRKGMYVELVLSHRPAEAEGGLGDRAAFFRRLARVAKHLGQIIVSSDLGEGVRLVRQLLSLLPQNNIVRAARRAQYLVRLEHSWRRARTSSHIVIFDQAFLQAIYTLAARSPEGLTGHVAEAIDLLPRPDLVIYVELGLPALLDRLRTRHVRQSLLERLLDADARVFENDFEILAAINARLAGLSQNAISLKGEGTADLTLIYAVIAKCMAGDATKLPAGSVPKRAVSRAIVSAACFAALVSLLTLFSIGLTPASMSETPYRLAASTAAAVVKTEGELTPVSSDAALHYASNGNFDQAGTYTPGKYGFNLADVSRVGQLDRLSGDVKALVWVGLCTGVTRAFTDRVEPFIGRPEVFGFYLMDDPDPQGLWGPHCPPANIAAEVDWIKSRMPAAKTFIALMNTGSFTAPSYRGSYNSENSHADLFGICVYPCTSSDATCDLDAVNRFISAAVAGGISREQIVPVFQAFGGGTWRTDRGGSYLLPKPGEAEALLQRWRDLIPAPVFDFVYSWGSQRGDTALATAPALASVFERHNRGLAGRRQDGRRGESGNRINSIETLATGGGR